MEPLLYAGDCMAWLPTFPETSINLILADPPFASTRHDGTLTRYSVLVKHMIRDRGLDWPKLWPLLYRVLQPGGAIILFGQQPFTSDLITSNRKRYKTTWYWVRNWASAPMPVRYRPLQLVQEIVVFGNGKAPRYFPQKVPRDKPVTYPKGKNQSRIYDRISIMQEPKTLTHWTPDNVLCFPRDEGVGRLPYQKPVALLEYLLKTYSQPGDTVLDFCMGTGTTGVACKNLGRRFIGIERERAIALLARERILTGKVSPETLKAARGLDNGFSAGTTGRRKEGKEG